MALSTPLHVDGPLGGESGFLLNGTWQNKRLDESVVSINKSLAAQTFMRNMIC